MMGELSPFTSPPLRSISTTINGAGSLTSTATNIRLVQGDGSFTSRGGTAAGGAPQVSGEIRHRDRMSNCRTGRCPATAELGHGFDTGAGPVTEGVSVGNSITLDHPGSLHRPESGSPSSGE